MSLQNKYAKKQCYNGKPTRGRTGNIYIDTYINMNYTLRSIGTNCVEFDQAIGSGYSLIRAEISQTEFEHYYRSVFKKDFEIDHSDDYPKLIAFIVCGTVYPIYDDKAHYIVNEGGTTLRCINKLKTPRIVNTTSENPLIVEKVSPDLIVDAGIQGKNANESVASIIDYMKEKTS